MLMPKKIAFATVEEFRRVYDVNVFSYLAVVRQEPLAQPTQNSINASL